MNKRKVKTQAEARQYAIDWQNLASGASMSWGELAEWQGIFQELADKFDLEEEFKENGII